MPRYKSAHPDRRYKQSPMPEFNDPVRTGDQFDEFNVEHDAFGREFDLWESPSPDDEVFQRELRDALNRGLVTLDPREEVWIRLYYGIPFPTTTQRQYSTPAHSTFYRHLYRHNVQAVLRDYPRTLEEIGQISGCTRANVQKVISDGLKKLRHHTYDLHDVLHPELEEARRSRKKRRKLDARRRARRARGAERGAPAAPSAATAPNQRSTSSERAAGAEPESTKVPQRGRQTTLSRDARATGADTRSPTRQDRRIYQILPKEHLPNYVREPARAQSTRQRAVDAFGKPSRMSCYPYCAWHPYKQPDVVCGICGDEYLSKLERYDPPVYFCYLCQKSVPVKVSQ